jgi:hypothetical protein
MIAPLQASGRWPTWLVFFLAGTPALVFYWLLSTSVVNLPVVDDYHAVLDFTNRFSRLADLGAKLGYILNFQHNEYKLAFENALFALQYEVFGHVDFTSLSMLGNAFVLLLFALLASAFRTGGQNDGARVLALLPVGLVLFQLQYASTLNFSMAGLQNLPVLAFALASIMLLGSDSRPRIVGACAAMLLAVAASGSGFLLAPVGAVMLAERRRWKHVAIWLAVTAAVGAVYFTHYDVHSSQASPDGSVAHSAAHFDIAYMLAFMGSSVARYQGVLPSIGVGVVLLAIWALAVRNGYSRKNPSVFYFCIFLMLTAAGVSAIRSGLGIEQSLASRYRIYSNLLLILSYIFLAETYLLQMKNRRAQRAIAGIVVACGLGFCALSDMAGYRFLKGRQQAVALEMAAWQAATLNAANPPPSQVTLNLDPAVARQLATGLYKPATAPLLESIQLGIYRPPGLAVSRSARVD